MRALLAVLWAFFGVRRRQDYARDAQSLRPGQVLAAGLLAGLVFVLGVWAIVKLAVRAL